MQITLVTPDLSLPSEEILPSALKTLLSKGDCNSVSSDQTNDHRLFSLFGIGLSGTQSIPAAVVTALIDFPEVKEKYWLRADPIYLRADLNKLVLFDSRSLMLAQTEARSLIKTVNDFLQEDGLKIIVGKKPDRWLIALDEPVELITSNPADIAGHDAGPWLLKGKDSQYWRRLGNELQMLLHDHPINQAREQQGKPPVNSLWFWGAGAVPEKPQNCQWDRVVTDDVTGQGLAFLAEKSSSNLPGKLSIWLKENQKTEKVLMILPEGSDLVSLESDYFQPLLHALKTNQIDRLSVMTSSLECTIQRKHLWRFWRQFKHLL